MTVAGPRGMRLSRAWIVLLAVQAAVAGVAIGRWVWATAQRAPILYGEGAVAHAAILARDGREYADPGGGALFVAANYTPLFFRMVSFGDPFVSGRLISILATLAVAAAIALRARRAGAVVALALAATWLAAAPVVVWGAAVKPDLVAVALTVGAVLAIDARRAALAGVLLALAVWAKPTELVPAVALAAYVAVRLRSALLPFGVAAVLAVAAASLLTHVPDAALLEHVVTWNALGWDASQVALLVVLALVVAGVTVGAAALAHAPGAVGAYALGAAGVVVLGGREGATFNYLLDLIAAATLALATVAPRLRDAPVYPVAATLQTLLAIALLDPLGVLPGHAITTGAWSPPGRVAIVAAIPGDVLVEDAGLLIASGREPAVDDLFLWSRLHDRGVAAADGQLVAAVGAGRFAAVVSEADLSQLDLAPLFERQRWSADLAAAVTARYRLATTDRGLYVYLPR